MLARKIILLFTNKVSDSSDIKEELIIVEEEYSEVEVKEQRYFWIIDPGHGKKTKGKRSPITEDGRQLLEYEFNHDVAKRLVSKLAEQDCQCALTITNPDEHGDDLAYRTQFANSYETTLPKIFVSIHANAGPGKSFRKDFRGIETWYYSNIGRRIARIFQRHLIKYTGLKDRGLKKTNSFFVLVQTDHPAILTENGFFNNPDEFELLLTDDYREAIANAHFDAIMEIETQGL